jgi:hypothetical protein
MLNKLAQRRPLLTGLHLLGFAVFAACSAVHAMETPNLRGTWVGNSMLEGERSSVKTTLSLGSTDEQNTTLRIDDTRSCTLKLGSYTEQGTDAWTLSFKAVQGGEACERLAQGSFSLRTGGPRKLELDVTYPGRDGSQNHRRGVLNRYP